MRTLILDQYNHQSCLIRLLGNTLTGLGWAFWVYLWLPLIAAITLLLGSHPEQATSAASQSLLALATTLGGHAGMVFIMIAVFFAWSLLQWLGKPYRKLALQKHQLKMKKSLSTAHTALDVRRWQHAQNMVVSHDEGNGLIKQVKVLNANKFVMPRNNPSTIRQTLPNIPTRQLYCVVSNITR